MMLDLLSQLPEIDNPLNGVTPSVSVFGVVFQGKLTLLLGGIWGVVLIATAAAVLLAAGKWAWAAKVTHVSESVMEGAGQFRNALVAFAAVVGISVIFGAIIWFFQ